MLLFVSEAIAQKQNHIWHFGSSAGIDFSTDPPTAFRGFLNNLEGTATICDPKTGQLLFAVDGNRIVDNAGVTMPGSINLIAGNGTTTQGAAIIPFADDVNKYHVFTADHGNYAGPNQGVFYSIVDMSLRDGYGDVTEKNINIFLPEMMEKITAIPHANECDAWIIAHRQSNEYEAVLLSKDTVSATHVVSAIGDNGGGMAGWLVASRDGKQLAYVSIQSGIEVVDFDRATGVISNVRRVYAGADTLYGACFSPDGTRLYIGAFGKGLYQFDLTRPVDEIPASRVRLGTREAIVIRPAPNGKLYFTTDNQSFLGAINNPNGLGAAADVQDSAIQLVEGTQAYLSLPNVLDAFMDRPFRPCLTPVVEIQSSLNTACAGDCIEFTALASEDFSLEWVVSDGRRIPASISTTICFPQAGTYTVELIGETWGGVKASTSKTFTIKPALGLNLKPYTILSDTIGAVFKIPLILSDSVSSVYQGSFSFDPERVDYLGAFDRDERRIDVGSAPENGQIVVTKRLISDSVIGYMYFTAYGQGELCQEVTSGTSSLSLAGDECLGTTAYQLCLTERCGNTTIAKYLRNSTISLHVSPNPAAEWVEITSNTDLGSAGMTLVDVNGIPLRRIVQNVGPTDPARIDIVGLPEGVYFLTIFSDKFSTRKSIVIAK